MGCSGCSSRFQALLEKAGFILCHNLGFALPIEGISCKDSPFMVTWDTIRYHPTRGAFEATKMVIKYRNLTEDERNRIVMEARMKHAVPVKGSNGVGVPNLRALIIPVARNREN